MELILFAFLLLSGQGLFALPSGQLSVSSDGTGSGTITSSPSGINCGNTCSATFPAGTQVSLTPNPASGSVLASWNGDCSGAGVCLILISSVTPQSAVATFNSENSNTISLTVSLSGLGNGSVTSAPSGINCGSNCAASFPPGTQVSLTAVPEDGSVFAGWSGGGCSGTGVCAVLSQSPESVSAAFNLASYPLAVSVSGNGEVTSSPAGIDCKAGNLGDCSASFTPGTTVGLTATPAVGSSFVGWGQNCSGSESCSIPMNSAQSVSAAFQP